MKLNDESMGQMGNTSFLYSGTRLDELGASEYTLVTILVDRSGSIDGFQRPMESCVKEVIKACKQSPRADTLMIRIVTFDNHLEELHGYKLLQNCNPDDYNNSIVPRGMTALFDAFVTGVESTIDYAKTLTENDFGVNAIIIAITDGADNASSYSPTQCKESLSKAVKGEMLESIRSILVGVDTANNPGVTRVLQQFKDLAEIDQYEDIGNADAKTLAKLADFVSKSISAQSQSLGTGGPSQPISLSI